MNKQKYVSVLAVSLIAAAFLVAGSAYAQTGDQANGRMGKGGFSGIVGKVSAVNGSTLTVVGNQNFNKNTTAITYTVNAANAKVTKNNTANAVSGIVVGDTIAVQGTVSGTNVTATTIRDGQMGQGEIRGGMGIAGTVASINGTTFTVTSKARPNGGTATTYTVNASSATVTKNGTASSVSVIAVGDTVMVQGTISGTTVTAKTIRDGVVQPAIQGNGQPVVAGKVTAISGDTITITNASNVTYTINATGAKIVENGVTSPTISNIIVGDNLAVQGAVNGNAVTASSVIVQKVKTNDGTGNSGENRGGMGGILGGIGNFFKKLFGF